MFLKESIMISVRLRACTAIGKIKKNFGHHSFLGWVHQTWRIYFSKYNKNAFHLRLGAMAHACNPSYSGGWGRRIAWTQEVEVAVSRDHTIVLQPGQQEWNSDSHTHTKRKRKCGRVVTDCFCWEEEKNIYIFRLIYFHIQKFHLSGLCGSTTHIHATYKSSCL